VEHDQPKQPWDRQPGETDKAFAGFVAYRDLPAQTRSLPAAHAEYVRQRDGKDRREKGEKPGSLPRPPGYFCAWSSKNDWEARATAYDAYLDAKARETAEDDYVERLQEFRTRQLKWAADASEGARKMLTLILSKIDELEAKDIDAADLWKHVKVITELMESASAMEKEALGIERVVTVLIQQEAL
jgi:hypothetical protein